MANLSSTRETPPACLPGTTSCAAILKLTSVLLAALLVGCAGNVQHRSANAQTELAKPRPAPVAAASPKQQAVSAQDEAPPSVFKDDSQALPQEDARQPERFVDDVAEPQHEDQPSAQQFTDDSSVAADDQAPAHQPFVDDEARAESESAGGPQRFTDDAGAAPEEDIVAAHPRFTDETTGVADEDTPASADFSDDSAPATEEAAAPSTFADEGAQSAPEELVREPDNFTDDDKPASTAETKTPPATVLPMTITVEADPLFDFDQYSIRAESRNKLDELIQQLRGTAYGEVRTVGFADPIGSALYNQSLSERRAASVKQYLASKGIPVERIRTEGRGETEEFATYKRCAGQSRQKLIACLQPDRRVEVTVTAGSQQ